MCLLLLKPWVEWLDSANAIGDATIPFHGPCAIAAGRLRIDC